MTGPSVGQRVLAGVFAPAVTTFDGWQGALTMEPFVANIQAHVGAGVHGVVVASSTGEAVLLTDEERGRLVGWARAAVPTDRWLIVGIGAESTALTIQRSQAACQRGAHAVLVLPPHHYAAAMTREALAGHFWRVLDESSCPVILRNAPAHTQRSLGPELVHALSAHDNMVGIVDASGDVDQLRLYVEAQSPTFGVLAGNGAMLTAARGLGVRGAMLDLATVATRLVLELHRAPGSAAPDARVEKAMTALSARIEAFGPAAVKATLDALGLHGGPVRSPLIALTAAQLADIRDELRAAGLLGPPTAARE